MQILMLTSYPNIKGPFPKIIPLLSKALRDQGCMVVEVPWGRRHDSENLKEKIFIRAADIFRIRSMLGQKRFDLMYIHNGAHDIKGIIRDLPLLMATRGLYKQAVLQIHGADLRFLQAGGHKAYKALNHLLFSFLGGVILSSRLECEVFTRFSHTCPFFVADDIYQQKSCPSDLAVPSKWNLQKGRPVIFFAARLIPEKGIQELMAAIPLVLARADCQFLIAGVGPLEAEVKLRLADPKIAGCASWVGYLDWRHLELAYCKTDIFVLPTYYFEGFPAVIQDALGHGLAIVTTPTRGVADHLVDGVHAKMVPPKDPTALANALVELLEKPALCKIMSEANLKKTQDFAPEVVGAQYIRILENILANGRGVRLPDKRNGN